MSKVLVEVSLPAAEKSFDIFVPSCSKMYEVNTLICTALNELSDGKFIGSESSILCDAESGNIFSVNMTVAELGIKNGSKLMLI